MAAMVVSPAFAGPGRTTYQAKIIKPDGYPLEAASVNFQFTILDPTGSCVLYSESYSAISMSSTSGLISFSLGTGLKSFPLNATTFEQVFSNSTPSLLCASGGPASYSPLATDTRKIIMQFNDGNGWQTLPAMNINAVPYAMYANDAQSLQGLSANSFVRLSTLATCTASEALHFNGAGFSCVALTSGAGAVTSGSVVTALGYTPANSATVSTLSSSISSNSVSIVALTSQLSSVSATVSGLASTIASLAAASPTTMTLNGLTSSTQTFAVASAGTTFGISSSNGVHTFSIPYASQSSVVGGLVSNADYQYFTNKLNATSAAVISALGFTPAQSGAAVTITSSAVITALGYTPSSASALTQANATTNGFLASADWVNFNSKLSTLDLGSVSATGTLSPLRLPAFNGDVTSVSGSASLVLANTGVTAGTYMKVTVDTKGRVTSGANLTSNDVTTALGFVPAQSGSAISSQWVSNGNDLEYTSGAVTVKELYVSSSGAIAPFGVEVSGTADASLGGLAGMYMVNTNTTSAAKLGIEFYSNDSTGINRHGAAILAGKESDWLGGGGSYPGYLSFWTRPFSAGSKVERLRISANGNVGIGTVSPTASLEVSGAIRATQICDRNGNNCHTLTNGWAFSSSSTGTVSQVSAIAPLQITGTSATPQVSLITSGSTSGDTLRFDGTNWQRTKLRYTDLVNSAASSPWPVSSCTSGQAIVWNSASDSFICSTIQIASSQLPQMNLASTASGGVTGVLPVANGGTGQTSFTTNTLLLGNGTSPINTFAFGSSGTILTSQGVGQTPIWQSLAALTSGGSNNSMVSSWPDAIYCNNGTDYSVLYLDTRESSQNRVWYSKSSGGAGHFMHFNMSSGAYVSHTAFTGFSACANKSISTIVSEGRYFNFAKGPVGVWLQSGNDAYYNAGSVAIGANLPTSSAILELSSTTKGFLPPRLTTTQRNAIASSAAGLMIYNSTVAKYQFYDGDSWEDLGTGASASGTGTLSSRQYFSSNGTFTVPAGITKIRVSVAGAGGGGGDYTGSNGNDGGNSTFGGTIVGAGGLGGARGDYGLDRNGNMHGGGSGGNITIIGAGGAGGPGRPTYQTNADPVDATGQTGGNGGLTISDLTVTPGASFAVVVGAGGAASGGSPGANGYVIVEWGGSSASGLTSSATATTDGYLTSADWLNFSSKLSTLDLGSTSATGTLSALRLPAFNGDVTSTSGSATLTLANSGVISGTYSSVSVDSKGRVISGSQLTATQISTALGYAPVSMGTITGGPGTSWQMVSRQVVTAASASTITFSGLNGDVDQVYRLVIKIKHNLAYGTSGILVRPNGDSGANYINSNVYGNSSGPFGSYNSGQTGIFIHGGGANQNTISVGEMVLNAETGNPRVATVAINQGNSLVSVLWSGTWSNTATNITSLVIEGALANAFATGTSFELWTKRTNVSAGGGFTDDGTNIYTTSLTRNVGIGTTTPSAKLDVGGDFALSASASEAAHHTGLQRLSNGTSILWYGGGTGNLQIKSGSTGPAGDRMTITASGSVGIGTTSPQATLDVSGPVRMGASVATCNSTIEGSQRYNSTSKVMEYCNGTSWLKIGSQNTRKYARLATSGSLTSGGGAITNITWASAIEDNGAFYSVGAPTRLTIPAGVTRVKLCAAVGVSSAGSITMNYFMFQKNNTDFAGNIIVSSDANDNNWGGYGCTPALTVTTGDYFELRYYSRDVGITFSGNKTWFTIEEQ